MMGGLTVETPEQARFYEDMFKGEPIRVGQHLEESPCVGEDHPLWRQAIAAGRDCPRVDLHPDDAVPFSLLLYQASEHTRGMFDTKFRVAVGHLPSDEQNVILDRVHAGLMSEAVVARLFPQPKERNGQSG